MAITKQKKKEILYFLEKQAKEQKSVLIMTTQDTEKTVTADINAKLRMGARQKGVSLKMIKINLLERVFKDLPDLSGQIYFAYSVDPSSVDEVTVPKTMVEMLKQDFKGNFSLVGSVVGEEFYDSQKTEILARTPSFDDSMSMVAGTINKIISQNASLIKEIPSKMARAFDAVKSQKTN